MIAFRTMGFVGLCLFAGASSACSNGVTTETPRDAGAGDHDATSSRGESSHTVGSSRSVMTSVSGSSASSLSGPSATSTGASDSLGTSTTGATSSTSESSGKHSGSHTSASGSASSGSSINLGVDPTTCAAAAAIRSNVGCEFWPTMTVNLVASIFDFAAVVANPQAMATSVTVTGPSGFTSTVNVPAHSALPVYLPWVAALKGPDDTPYVDAGVTSSVAVTGGAYHLVSTLPVTVYQFNALEYQGVGGPAGKSWAACPVVSGSTGCFSYTNDASMLIPVASMTGIYRVTGEHGSSDLTSGSVVAITGTHAGTTVTVKLSPLASIVASVDGAIQATGANGTLTLSLNAGDVAELIGVANDNVDLSGSLITASAPVQVIAARQCANQPDPVAACDHLESTVLPVETWGKDYVVTVPTSPHAAVIGHAVRFYGNADDTTLTYSPSKPPGCPSTLSAGEVVDCTGTPDCATGMSNSGTTQGDPVMISCVTTSFEVKGSHEFAVSSFMLGGSAVDPTDTDTSEGDPSMSPMIPTEQFRATYMFVAPTDYSESYADIVAPTGASLVLDDSAVTATPSSLDADWSVFRITLPTGNKGAHTVKSAVPFGLQVIGYGAYTSYQYPAGLELDLVAPAP